MVNSAGMEKAIVIGGGMAGLMTARVLADYYAEVLIIDKDHFPAQPTDRAGVPHGFHPHRFTNRGKMITESLFPGYEEELTALGSPSSFSKTAHIMNQYGVVSGPYMRNDIKFSRATLEWVIRGRVSANPNVRFLQGYDVLELIAAPDLSAITGVRIRERKTAGTESVRMADLVVDAGGRTSRLPQWLEGMGYELPKPDLMKASIGYSTRRYTLPPAKRHLAEEWDVVNIMGQPENNTFTGVFSFIENQVAELLLYRPGGQFPPTDAEAFEQTAAGLPSPLIAEIVRGLEPVGNPRGFRVAELYRRHYEKIENWPAGLLVLGDAYCIYDPIFGQGMTVAAIEAEILQSSLREQLGDPKPQFEQRVLKRMQREAITPAWWLNCAADLQWEGVEYEAGAEPLEGIDFCRKVMDLLLKEGTANKNFQLYGMYWGINTLAVPLGELFNPQMIRTVLEASDEGKAILDELLEQHRLPLEEVLDQIVPQ